MKERAKAARTGMRVKARKPRKFGRMNVQPISVLRLACFLLPRLCGQSVPGQEPG